MAAPVDEFNFGPYRLDTGKHVLWRGGEVVALPPKAVTLLSTLVRARGDVVAKEELMTRVWPDTAVEDSNLTVTVSALRKALGRRTDGSPYIETLSRRGYRFLAARAEGRGDSLQSLAVLPFHCLSGEDRDGFGAAMADAVITRLSGTGRVRVRPTACVLRYAGRESDTTRAAQELGVEAVLSGSYQRREDRIRLTVQLVPSEAAAPSWSATFEESLSHLFRVQELLADQVASALRLKLDARARRALARRPTEDLEAWQAFARGAHFWHRLSPKSLHKAIACFEEARHHDPSYALAHVGRASGYVALAATGGDTPRHAWPVAAEAAAEALTRDPELPEAHVVSGYVKALAEWDWVGADAALQQAIALDPRSVTAHQWYAFLLCCLGRFEAAEWHTERALRENPVSLVGHGLRGLRLSLRGEAARACAEYAKVVELEPAHFLGYWGCGATLLRLGRAEEGLEALRRACELSLGNVALETFFAWGLARAGRKEESGRLLADLEPSHGDAYVSPYQRATIHLALGRADRGLELLEQAATDRDPWLALLQVDPKLDALRAEKRFVAVLDQVFPGSARQEKIRKILKTPRGPSA